ncbi:MAG TPA: hypothetical protein VFX60_13355 [Micromonospora sp.]|nr:hypothetical protein [Micromonospora sp.]
MLERVSCWAELESDEVIEPVTAVGGGGESEPVAAVGGGGESEPVAGGDGAYRRFENRRGHVMALIDHHEAVGGEQLGNVIAPRECLERGDINYAGELGLAKDVGGAEGAVARATVDGYLDSLSRLRLTENSPAWAPHMRSATPLQSSPPATSPTLPSRSQHL